MTAPLDPPPQMPEPPLPMPGERAWRDVVENALDGVMYTIPDGRILYSNRAACSILGASPFDLRARGRVGLSDPDDRRWSAALAERRRVGRVRFVATMLRPDGTALLAEIASATFTIPGGELRSTVVFRDATHRVRLEQPSAASYDVALLLLSGSGQREVLTTVATRACTLVGATSAAVLTAGEDPGGVVVMAGIGAWESHVGRRRCSPGSPLAWAMTSKRPMILDDVAAPPTEDGRTSAAPAMVVPIVAGERNFGNLLLHAEPGSPRYDESHLAVAAAFVESVGAALSFGEARASVERELRRTNEQLEVALERRIIIEQAKGFISASRVIGADEAFERLRQYARSHRTNIHDVAAAVLERQVLP